MAMKYFTNAGIGFEGKSIAINPTHIVSCFENTDDKGDVTTILYGVTGASWQVQDAYMECVARLNEV
jgi:hypothetical protein